MPLDLDVYLLKQLVKEEWRLHKSLSGGVGSTLFPLIIFVIASLCAFASQVLLRGLSMVTLILILHVASVGYGFFVGGFGALAENIMTRRLGQVNLLLQLPQTYPITFRKMMALFYMKDSIFYLTYTFVPMVLALGLVGGFFGYSLIGVALIGVTTFLAFLLGMGVSFVISAVVLRSKLLGAAVSLMLLLAVLLVWPMSVIEPYQLILPLGYWVARSSVWLLGASAAAVVLGAIGVWMMRERFEVSYRRYPESYLRIETVLGMLRGHTVLVAKEWLELVRSGSLTPIIGGYSLHLIAVYFISWIFENGLGLSLGFNVLFFSALVGFLGVLTYSSLTSIEHNEYLNVMPVSVDYLVKAKIIVYLLVTSVITVSYVILIGYIKGELALVPLAFIVAACNSVYVVAVTAYLTGLWTNTMFFEVKTILGFSAFILPVVTVVEIGALLLPYMPVASNVLIILSSLVEIVVSFLLFRGLGKRWGRATFSYVANGM
jgi:hypothetical protein